MIQGLQFEMIFPNLTFISLAEDALRVNNFNLEKTSKGIEKHVEEVIFGKVL